MVALRARASDPGLRQSSSTFPASQAGNDQTTAVKQHSTRLRIMLGPESYQCLDMSIDSSSDEGDEADDEEEEDPKWPGTELSHGDSAVDVAARSRSRSNSSPPHSPQSAYRSPLGHGTSSRSEAGDREIRINGVGPRRRLGLGSAAQIGKNRPLSRTGSERSAASQVARQDKQSYRDKPDHGCHTGARQGCRSQSTPPVVMSAESSTMWCRTQPGLEVDCLLFDDDDTGSPGRSRPSTAEKDPIRLAIKRVELLDEMTRERTVPKYVASMMPHARASRRPALPTIASDDSPPQPTSSRQYHIGKAQTPPATSIPVLKMGRPDALHFQRGSCDACDRSDDGMRKVKMVPCSHIVCSACFGSSISAVSAKSGQSRCTACLGPVDSFTEAHCFNVHSSQRSSKMSRSTDSSTPDESSGSSRQRSGVSTKPTSLGGSEDEGSCKEPVILRIDNVAWDITPAVVASFLPPGVLSKVVCPVHILLDRFDGRTRDYLYVEVASIPAARKVLQSKQNELMPCGPLSGAKRRPITITLVPHQELLEELRPRCASDLNSLLTLCEAATTIPYLPTLASGLAAQGLDQSGKVRQLHDRSSGHISGAAHYVKSRHGPFYALMSVLSKLSGRKSPAYWDLYRVTSGAIAALATAVDRSPYRKHARPHPGLAEDKRVLAKLKTLHQRCFAHSIPSSPE